MQVPKRKPGQYADVKPDYHMTPEAIQELKDEHEKLLKRVRPKVIEEMQAAAELGDFSENHAYQMAKHRLRGINSRLETLERQITRAIPIEKKSGDKIELGSTVTIESNGKKKTYQILGAHETDPSTGKISHSSPLGSILLNRKVGNEVELNTGEKIVKYKILKVE